MIENEVLEDILGQAGHVHRLGQTFARQQGLAGMFQHHGIAGDQCRHDAVDRGQEGIVPGRDDEDHAHRHPAQFAAEGAAIFNHLRGEGFRGDLRHVFGTFAHPAHLAAIAHRAAHHPGQFRHDPVVHGDQRLDAGHDQPDAFIQRPRRPVRLRRVGAGDSRARILGRQHVAGHINLAIDRRYQLDLSRHLDFPFLQARSNPRAVSQSETTRFCSSISQSAARW